MCSVPLLKKFQFYWWKKLEEYSDSTLNLLPLWLLQLADKLYPCSCCWIFAFYAPAMKSRGGGILIYPLSVRSSVRIQIHGLQDVYTHNGGVHVHRILIFFKYSQNDRKLDLVILFVRPDIDTWFVWLSPPTVLELQL